MAVLTATPAKAKVRLRSLSEMPVYIKALVYADSGAGKTYLLGTAPKPVHILSEWAVALPTLQRVAKDYGANPDLLFVETWDDLMGAYEYVRANLSKYESVCLDGLTDVNNMVMSDILAEAFVRSSHRAVAHDRDALEQSDWNKVINRMTYVIKLFRDLPIDVYMTALEQDVKQEARVAPLVTPVKLYKKLPSFFNMVGRLEADVRPNKPSVRRLYLDSTLTYMAKNPGGALPPIIENPNLTDIVAKIRPSLQLAVPEGNDQPQTKAKEAVQ